MNANLPDILAILASWGAFAAYSWAARRTGARRPSLLSASALARAQWGRSLASRDARIVDSALIASLSNVATFFASTTVVIIGALVALCATPDRIDDLRASLSGLPFALTGARSAFELKVLAVASFFLYAFFKFTWAIRQMNFCAVLVGAAAPAGPAAPDADDPVCSQFALLCTYSASNFNQGLRAHYWAFASCAWLWNPWATLPALAAVAAILWTREFDSRTLRALDAAFPRPKAAEPAEESISD